MTGVMMRVFKGALAAILLSSFLPCFSGPSQAQDMDTLEGIYREQYEEFTARASNLQRQIDDLNGVLSQIQTVIGQVNSLPATDYAQQADRYQQLELLLPSATRFSRDISQRQRQLDEIQRRKAELRSTILARQSDLPIWWRE